MDISEIVDELKKILPEENFHVEPETSKNKLIELEDKYGMTTFEFANMLKDISRICEEERYYWLDTMETLIFFGGIIEGIND